MIVRTAIEYLAPRTIRVTTPFRQRTLNIPGHNETYTIDFGTLNLVPDALCESRVIVYWKDYDKTLVVDDMDAKPIGMPHQCTNVILKVEV
jgi:hypothetical protein